MYGANFTENDTASVYTFSSTTGEMFVNGIGEGTPGGNRIFRTIWDGNGVDTYDLSNYSTNLTIDLNPGGWSVFSTVQLANLGQGFIARGNLFNALQFNGDLRSLIENAKGGTGADTIKGNQADNVLSGGQGADTIYGGDGSDTLYGGVAAVDSVEIGYDVLYGENGNDFIYGNGGNDTIIGGAGSDFLIGGTGNDLLIGGLSESDTTDTCDDFMRGGDGADTLYGNQGNDTLAGGAGQDRVFGGAGNDLIYGGALLVDQTDGADVLSGGVGNDDIRGNGGDDTLYGDDGDDILVGGLGNDEIYGGTGNDYLRGGDGIDRFVFDTVLNPNTNVDTIQNFVSGDDRIVLLQSVFTGLGATIDEVEFCIGAAANAAAHRVIYNDMTGQLYYDADGNGAAGQVQFAWLNPQLPIWYLDFTMTA
jgi:serralysin